MASKMPSSLLARSHCWSNRNLHLNLNPNPTLTLTLALTPIRRAHPAPAGAVRAAGRRAGRRSRHQGQQRRRGIARRPRGR
eukprot:scaffold129363_cov63-Phaeocystis_antarctica.AAC.6